MKHANVLSRRLNNWGSELFRPYSELVAGIFIGSAAIFGAWFLSAGAANNDFDQSTKALVMAALSALVGYLFAHILLLLASLRHSERSSEKQNNGSGSSDASLLECDA